MKLLKKAAWVRQHVFGKESLLWEVNQELKLSLFIEHLKLKRWFKLLLLYWEEIILVLFIFLLIIFI